MSRTNSPALPPEDAYNEPPSAQTMPRASAYYDPTEPRQLVTDEILEDISRITDPSQTPALENGQYNNPTAVDDLQAAGPQRPMTPQNEQQTMGVEMQQIQSQQYVADGQAGETYGDGTNKRKRSKVSRACDECRRKKIRCDATKDDGTVETCSNCKRINALCAFSRVPMKRGPSKGYIKELSERVQQVESQMETQRSMSQMAPPLGFRHSLDGRQSMDSNAPSIFDNAYSPSDGPLSKKRTYSVLSDSGVGAGPFSHFLNRDRMPSTAGGWGLPTTSQSFRDTRFSIALAPDQLPDLPPGPLQPPVSIPETPRSVKPFWTDVLSPDSRRDKLASAETRMDEEVLPQPAINGYQYDIEREFWANCCTDCLCRNYLREVHPVLPLLPSTVGSLERHIRICLSSGSSKLVYALRQILTLLQPSDETAQNHSTAEIVDLLYAHARRCPRDRNTSENFVLLWLCSLVYISEDNEISRQKQTDLRYLLQLMVDTSLFLIKATSTDSTEAVEDEIDLDKNLSRRAFNVVAILARLYSLGSGADDLVPEDDEVWALIADSDDIAMMTDSTSVLARYCNYLSGVRLANFSSPTNLTDGRAKANMSVRLMRQQVREIKTKLPEPMSKPARETVDQLDLLLNLATARSLSRVNVYATVEVFLRAEEIVRYLLQKSDALSDLIEPLLSHLYVLSTLTFLEFAAAPDHSFSRESDPAVIALESLSNILRLLRRLEPKLRRPSLGSSNFKWTNALMHLILSRHPDVLSSKPHSLKTQTTSELQSMYLDPTAPATSVRSAPQSPMAPNGSSFDSGRSSLAAPNPSSDTLVDSAPSSNADHGHPTQAAESTTPTASTFHSVLQSLKNDAPDQATKSALPPSGTETSRAVERALSSSTWQIPDFTLLQRHGWMSVLAELTI